MLIYFEFQKIYFFLNCIVYFKITNKIIIILKKIKDKKMKDYIRTIKTLIRRLIKKSPKKSLLNFTGNFPSSYS